MLGKLLKHEFRATARVMLPLFGVLLVLAALGNLSTRVLDATDNTFLNILSVLIIIAFSIAMGAVCIMSVVIIIQRFYKNLLADEGYLMFTLPVSVHSLIWSKIIVSVVWFIGAFFAVMLASLILAFRVEYVYDFIHELRYVFQQMSAYYSLDYVAISVEFLVLSLIGCVAICLVIYASMAVGYGFTKHKVLLSIVFFFAFQFASQFIGTFVVTIFGNNFNLNLDIMSVWHAIMCFCIAAGLVYCAIFYFITTLSLKKRLNLE